MKAAILSLAGVALMLFAFAIAYFKFDMIAPVVQYAAEGLYHGAVTLFDKGTAATDTLLQQNRTANRPQQQGAPTQLLLETENLLQNPELPNGCEATSLAIVLRSMGWYADNVEIAYEYLPRQDFSQSEAGLTGPHPNTAYAGDPAKASGGYYCFAQALAAGAENYLHAQYATAEVQNLTGISADGLAGWLQNGTPVVVWTTMNYGDAQYCATGWTLPDGSYYLPYSNLHCVVLVGYTETEYILCDPLREGYTYVPQESFIYGFEALGRQAVVIDGQ